MRRTAAAAALTLLALGSVAAGWGVTALRASRAEWADAEAAPANLARSQAEKLGQELGDRLERLRQSESQRPYYEYQNLFHDPRGASEGRSVTPSSLAQGPPDEAVEVNFQISPQGQVTVPTINDELPQLSKPERQASDREWLRLLQPAAASLVSAAPHERTVALQRQVLDPSAYAQNQSANTIFLSIQNQLRSPRPPAGKVEIVTPPLTFATVALAGRPRLVALRRVQTPDGDLTQGFVISPEAWLRGRTLPLPAVAIPGDALYSAPLAPGWRLSVDPSALQSEAAAHAARLKRAFLLRSGLTFGLALVCGALVVLLVARAEQLAAQRSAFAAAAAHELRTPLAGLHLYSDMLAEGLGQPEKQRDYARRIASEAARLGRVVGNVLGFTQLERSALSVDPRPGDAAAAVRATTDRMAPSLAQAGVTLTAELPESAQARFDEDALGSILQNLIDNAAKYGKTPVEVRLLPEPGGVRIEVADRGQGVPRALRGRLFRPFRRGKSEVPGLGLGLALSQKQAKAMGARVEYADRDGGGALFSLWLPGV